MRTGWIIVLCIWSLVGVGQDTLNFLKVGDYGSEEGVGIVPFNDSVYILLANTADEFNNSDYQLISYSLETGISDAVNYGTFNSDRALDFASRELNTVVVGITNGNAGTYEGFVHGIENDSLQFEYYWGVGIENTWWQASQVLMMDTAIIVVFEDVGQNETPWVHRLTLSGELLEMHELTGLQGAHITEMQYDEQSELFWLSGKRLTQESDQDAFLMAFDDEFQEQWSYTFNNDRTDVFTDFARLNDSSIVIVGYTNSLFEEDEDILVIRLNEFDLTPDSILIQGYDAGNAFNRDDRANAVFVFRDTIFITGTTRTYGQGGVDGYITLLQPDLVPIPRGSTFGTAGDDYSFSIFRDSLALFGLGTTYEKTKGLSDVLLWKRESFENTTLFTSIEDVFLVSSGLVLNADEVLEESALSLSDMVTVKEGEIHLKADMWDRTEQVKLYSSLGQHVATLDRTHHHASGLPTGVYILVYSMDTSEVTTSKFFVP